MSDNIFCLQICLVCSPTRQTLHCDFFSYSLPLHQQWACAEGCYLFIVAVWLDCLFKHLSSHQALDTQHVLYGSLFRCPLVYFVSQTTRLRRLASVGLQCPWGPSWLIFVSSKITEEYLILLARWKLVQYPNSMLRTDRNILKLKDKWAEWLNRRLHFFLYVFSLNDMLLTKIMLFIIVFRFRNIFQAWRSGSSTLEH